MFRVAGLFEISRHGPNLVVVLVVVVFGVLLACDVIRPRGG